MTSRIPSTERELVEAFIDPVFQTNVGHRLVYVLYKIAYRQYILGSRYALERYFCFKQISRVMISSKVLCFRHNDIRIWNEK